MRLRENGIDIFYIDESHDKQIYVVTAIAVPFLRKVSGIWTIVWPNHLDESKEWRRRMKQNHSIPISKELHGNKISAGTGHYNRGKWNFTKAESRKVYGDILSDITFIPEKAVVSVSVTRGKNLYGRYRLEAAMHGLFQRMRLQCRANQVNAMVFFDSGHPEYRTLYRRAQVYLETGSMMGGWGSGTFSKNLPLDMFTKDANEKDSKHCLFTQATDLIAYAAFQKRKYESGAMHGWQSQYNYGDLYDSVPGNIINTKASIMRPRDGIVRIT